MNEVTLYHNPRCSKSRQTLALLEERGIPPEIIEYLQPPPAAPPLSPPVFFFLCYAVL